jgi:hypothetical protein
LQRGKAQRIYRRRRFFQETPIEAGCLSFQPPIMVNDQMPVCAQLNIKLNAIYAQLNGA